MRIVQVKYSPSANLFVTASKDGNIKIWDGVSNKCVSTFVKAHDGNEICSVVFTRNSKVATTVSSVSFINDLKTFVHSESVNLLLKFSETRPTRNTVLRDSVSEMIWFS